MTAYHLGCPVWACDHWRGTLFESNAPRRTYLTRYASAFDTVEGNSTFYGLPSTSTVHRWAESVAPGFRFALKFPRAISHDRRLIRAERETAEFLELLEILAAHDRLGPSFLQLPPDFAADWFEALESYLRALPVSFPFAVEVRHADWFDGGASEARLDDLLRELAMDRVIFDSRALFSAPPSDETERVSQGRKPRVPLRHTVTARNPFVRFVGRNDVTSLGPWIDEWADVVAGWIERGLEPYVFTHAPDDTFAPAFARAFHTAVRDRVPSLPDLPTWPGEIESDVPVQRTLF